MIDPFAPTDKKELPLEDGDVAILCEGNDECAVVNQLTKAWGKRPKVGTRTYKPQFNWADEIAALVKQVSKSHLAAIGFVFDAEKTRASREADLTRWYAEAGLTKPRKPLSLTTSVIDGYRFKTAYLINPHRKKAGAIESLFVPQIQASSRWPCIRQLLRCYERQEPFKVDVHKLIVRTFIAHGNAYNTTLHVALQDRLLSCDGAEFDPLRKFLDLLRNASPLEKAARSDGKT